MRTKCQVITVISILLICTFVATGILPAADYKYVGSKKSNKYHYPSCRWAEKIKPYNLVTFGSAKEAQEAGYVPCKVCKPSLQDEKGE
jgi:methylphosphotriester-DNA--protein-cysteine methyltransferase